MRLSLFLAIIFFLQGISVNAASDLQCHEQLMAHITRLNEASDDAHFKQWDQLKAQLPTLREGIFLLRFSAENRADLGPARAQIQQVLDLRILPRSEIMNGKTLYLAVHGDAESLGRLGDRLLNLQDQLSSAHWSFQILAQQTNDVKIDLTPPLDVVGFKGPNFSDAPALLNVQALLKQNVPFLIWQRSPVKMIFVYPSSLELSQLVAENQRRFGLQISGAPAGEDLTDWLRSSGVDETERLVRFYDAHTVLTRASFNSFAVRQGEFVPGKYSGHPTVAPDFLQFLKTCLSPDCGGQGVPVEAPKNVVPKDKGQPKPPLPKVPAPIVKPAPKVEPAPAASEPVTGVRELSLETAHAFVDLAQKYGGDVAEKGLVGPVLKMAQKLNSRATEENLSRQIHKTGLKKSDYELIMGEDVTRGALNRLVAAIRILQAEAGLKTSGLIGESELKELQQKLDPGHVAKFASPAAPKTRVQPSFALWESLIYQAMDHTIVSYGEAQLKALDELTERLRAPDLVIPDAIRQLALEWPDLAGDIADQPVDLLGRLNRVAEEINKKPRFVLPAAKPVEKDSDTALNLEWVIENRVVVTSQMEFSLETQLGISRVRFSEAVVKEFFKDTSVSAYTFDKLIHAIQKGVTNFYGVQNAIGGGVVVRALMRGESKLWGTLKGQFLQIDTFTK